MLAVLAPVRPARDLSHNRDMAGCGLGTFPAVMAAAFLHALSIALMRALAVLLILPDHPDEALGVASLTRMQIRKLATGSLHKVQQAGIDMISY